MKQYTLPKSKRLASNEQFKTVMAHKHRVSNDLLVIYVAKNLCGYPRVGVSVGKSCGKAVIRNRLKRLLREAFRQNQDNIPLSYDYLLMISPKWDRETIKQLKLEQIQKSFLTLVNKAITNNCKEKNKA